MSDEAHYPPLSPVSTGLRGTCPRCGTGKLFDGFLTIDKRCTSCDLDYGFADAGDGPAVFIILIVGFLVVGGALITEVTYQPHYWLHAVIWFPLIILLPLVLLRPAKGLMTAIQYRHKAQEGRLNNETF
ncbi:MAG: DUF983 domain-containing protein [Fimbriimonadaceae bacterium]|nr:DUF983 domain-containing protein [Alphaproteobacteria bacterium]